MRTVYALSDRGAHECATERGTLPAELRGLLRMVNGRRTREDLLAATGKSALTAGGLRWLTASGYIHSSGMADLAAEVAQEHRPPQRAAAHTPAGTDEVCRAMSNFMLRSIQRHLGRYAYERQIEAATTLNDLLPHLNPLIDAIVARGGAPAGAEFADAAAMLLQPPVRVRASFDS